MRLEHWNPALKAATVLVSVLLLAMHYLVALNLAVFVSCLLAMALFSNAQPRAVLALLAPACFAALGLFLMGLYYARGGGAGSADLGSLSGLPFAVRAALGRNLYTALQLSTRLLAYAGFGILFALSTDSEYFIASLLHQCRLPPQFAYGLLAALHLMPGMARETQTVRRAFAVRGVAAGPLSLGPLFTMLVNSVRWSECVAMAMESKGFCGSAPRTYACVPRVRAGDWAVSLAVLGALLAGSFLFPF